MIKGRWGQEAIGTLIMRLWGIWYDVLGSFPFTRNQSQINGTNRSYYDVPTTCVLCLEGPG